MTSSASYLFEIGKARGKIAAKHALNGFEAFELELRSRNYPDFIGLGALVDEQKNAPKLWAKYDEGVTEGVLTIWPSKSAEATDTPT